MFITGMITVEGFVCLSSCTLEGTIGTGENSIEVFDNILNPAVAVRVRKQSSTHRHLAEERQLLLRRNLR